MALIQTIFLDKINKIRSIWWIPFFFVVLVLFLLPTILIAQRNSVDVPIAIQAIIILIATGICQLIRKEPIIQITGKFNLSWFRQFFVGLLMGAILMIFPAVTLTVFGFARWQINDSSFSTIIAGTTVFVGVAIAEELLFRGFLFQRLIESLGQWPAQLIVAGMFLLTHINNPGMTGITKLLASLNIFIASILFGLAFIKTKSLAMPLGLHFMANFIQGTILGFGVSGQKEQSILKAITDKCPIWLSGGAFGLEASLLGLITLIIILTLFYRMKSTNEYFLESTAANKSRCAIVHGGRETPTKK
jgi:membrane protease YdiL (CAAX protease family)